ncbi:DUF6182 family protein [Streptomyces sp. NPDC005500]|uniref:DUF6182 family protein n=1 Tax=Streptomyces sp. NPDC005500 TaxID=3155007 RepID=UPI0033B16CF9
MFTQTHLRSALEARIQRAGAHRDEAAAIAVIHSFDLEEFSRSLLEFVYKLSHVERELWLADFTRTLFLAGNPLNLAGRHPTTTLAPSCAMGWYAPASNARHRELRLLLRALEGELPASLQHTVITVPGTAPGPDEGAPIRKWRLAVDIREASLSRYLVHLTHTLAEAAITGTFRPGDQVRITHTTELAQPRRGFAYLRVHQDADNPDLLRAYTCLWEETHGD